MAAPLITPDYIMELLRGVIDPELGSNIVELGMAKGATIDDDGKVTVTIALTTMGCPLRGQIMKDIKARVTHLPGVTSVKIDWTELNQAEKAAAMAVARKNVSDDAPDTEISATTKVIMLASGKGGVGKSTVTVNLAAGLANEGFTVGVLDADIWGHSIPRMLGVDGRIEGSTASGEKKMLPNVKHIGTGTLKVISMGFLVDEEETALMWRGLILNRAVQHFLEDVSWGELDYLLIDMPPGTGDVQMGLAKLLPRSEMIIITTPSRSAQKVATRAADMGRKNYLRIVGVIENMTSFIAPDGTEHRIFGTGGGDELAADVGVPLLGRIPIEATVADGGDNGDPVVLRDGPAAEAFRAIVRTIVDEAVPPAEMAGCSARLDGPFEANVAVDLPGMI
ncbi:MAG: Mrp/NBP35 family ATP-binding protein [Acidimicrobiales bacterium]